MYTVRKANVRDYKSVSNLVLEVHKLHVKNRPDVYLDVDKVLDEEEFKKSLDDNNTNIFVVENNKNKDIQAYAWVKIMSSPSLSIVRKSKFLYIEDICIKSTCRRSGLGKLLFEYIKEFANKEKIESIQLSVWNFNKDAIEFYKSMGMTVRNIKMELEVR
ncbi:GNAT family N-acetyltransferase [Clostridium massiliodielmoense]|uniref:GNAT family N-acetyltransferase n=1 Tax=Clostridium massiliodielmoense TaxID=1776385 RepID=UPI000A2722F0|nr:GNAT family N-acetyltransferase [Clostridium massiliodielmoense]